MTYIFVFIEFSRERMKPFMVIEHHENKKWMECPCDFEKFDSLFTNFNETHVGL